MRALVTAGGTRVYLDDVRYVGNTSGGGFGAKIVKALYHFTLPQSQVDITHLKHKDATPVELSAKNGGRVYNMVGFDSYQEYAERLERLIRTTDFDIVFLAAAVSDYGIDKQAGKISSAATSKLREANCKTLSPG